MEWSCHIQMRNRLELPMANRRASGIWITLEDLTSPGHLIKHSRQPLGRGRDHLWRQEPAHGTWDGVRSSQPACPSTEGKRGISPGPGKENSVSFSNKQKIYSHVFTVALNPWYLCVAAVPSIFQWNVSDQSGHKDVGSVNLGECHSMQHRCVLRKMLCST